MRVCTSQTTATTLWRSHRAGLLVRRACCTLLPRLIPLSAPSPPQGLVVTTLGTAAFRATRRRALSSLALCRGKDLLVFNAGGLSEGAGSVKRAGARTCCCFTPWVRAVVLAGQRCRSLS